MYVPSLLILCRAFAMKDAQSCQKLSLHFFIWAYNIYLSFGWYVYYSNWFMHIKPYLCLWNICPLNLVCVTRCIFVFYFLRFYWESLYVSYHGYQSIMFILKNIFAFCLRVKKTLERFIFQQYFQRDWVLVVQLNIL